VSTASFDLAITPARGGEDLADVARLFREYQIAIGVDLTFQGFEEELSGLPGHYAPPRGEILMARAGRAAAGVVALRPLPNYGGARLTCGGAGLHSGATDGAPTMGGVCEMKRLYVRPAFRAAKLGRHLAERVIGEARRLGYRSLVLDTLKDMTAAQALYRALGFDEIEAYYDNPLDGARYFQLAL
jgi:ribosomal protein S18 acetylase RimI-like enzyme